MHSESDHLLMEKKNPTDKYWSVKASLSWIHWSQQNFHQENIILHSKMKFWSKATGEGQSMRASFPNGKADKFRCCKAEREDFLPHSLVCISLCS